MATDNKHVRWPLLARAFGFIRTLAPLTVLLSQTIASLSEAHTVNTITGIRKGQCCSSEKGWRELLWFVCSLPRNVSLVR